MGMYRAFTGFVRRYIWHNLNCLSQTAGALIAYTRTNNDSISGDSEWYAEDRRLYRVVRDAVDWLFLKAIKQQNHCFEALYNDYIQHKLRVEEFERRYGEGVQYVHGDPVPQRRD
jgi:hypothetical protein